MASEVGADLVRIRAKEYLRDGFQAFDLSAGAGIRGLGWVAA